MGCNLVLDDVLAVLVRCLGLVFMSLSKSGTK